MVESAEKEGYGVWRVEPWDWIGLFPDKATAIAAAETAGPEYIWCFGAETDEGFAVYVGDRD